jgi:hypothetical protein
MRSEWSENNEAFSIADFELRISDFGGSTTLQVFLVVVLFILKLSPPNSAFWNLGETQRGSDLAILLL